MSRLTYTFPLDVDVMALYMVEELLRSRWMYKRDAGHPIPWLKEDLEKSSTSNDFENITIGRALREAANDNSVLP